MIYRRVEIDAGRLTDKESVHDYIREIFGVEEPFGHNLDAVADVLSEVADDYDLVFDEHSLKAICNNTYSYKVLLVLGRSSEENPHIRIKFN